MATNGAIVDHRLCVGWDLGTVSSCIAVGPYEHRKSPDGSISIALDHSKIVALPLEPGAQNNVCVDTVCTIAKSNVSGEIPKVLWGQLARRHCDSNQDAMLLRFPKLTSLGPNCINDFAGTTREFGLSVIKKEQEILRQQLELYNWSVVDFLAAGFKALWEIAKPKLVEQFYHRAAYDDRADDAKFIDIVVSRPSMWRLDDDHQLQEALEKGSAAHDKTIATIRLCDEADVALFGMTFNEVNLEEDLVDGAVVAVADLGGGTSDSASFLIETRQPFRASEITEATGAFAGAAILHNEFGEKLNKVLGWKFDSGRSNFDWDKVCHDLTNSFASELTDYDSTSEHADDTTAIKILSGAAYWLPQDADAVKRHLDHGFKPIIAGLEVTHRLLRFLFKPYVERIGALIEKQIRAAETSRNEVDLLLVVGGFSKNPYSQGEIRRKLFSTLPTEKIRFPPCYDKATTAKGAARYAADQSLLTSRVLKASIGFKQDLGWEEGFGKLPVGARMGRDGNENCVNNAIRCLFWKGQSIGDTASASFEGDLELVPPTFRIEQLVYAASVRKRSLEFMDMGDPDQNFLIIEDADNEIIPLGTPIASRRSFLWYTLVVSRAWKVALMMSEPQTGLVPIRLLKLSTKRSTEGFPVKSVMRSTTSRRHNTRW